jgi:hypothetical protein
VAPPHTIFYRFANALKVTKVSIKGPLGNNLYYAPTDYKIVASNGDDCVAASAANNILDFNIFKAWDILVHRNDVTWSKGEEKIEVIPENKIKFYRCYGIKINEVQSGVVVQLKEIRMWV